jgi:hypothetical protein
MENGIALGYEILFLGFKVNTFKSKIQITDKVQLNMSPNILTQPLVISFQTLLIFLFLVYLSFDVTKNIFDG